ncbi:MAG: hypothetical protein GW809_02320 [Bacteroidetes bacterium]|nr:hypothetical protein [Bacteroidota bacterium]NCQ10987.1 hypothetical protein [Bacteroidota bacterium]
MKIRFILLTQLCLFLSFTSSFAQVKRTRAKVDGPISAVFKAPKLIVFNTTKNTNENTLHMMIQHSFGPVESLDNYQNLYGLDGTANIRFSLDYGINDAFSVGLGRTKLDKAYDFRAKYTLTQQSRSGSTPFSISFDATLGIITESKTNFSFTDRLFTGVSLPISRKFSEDLSLLLYPSFAYFARAHFIGPAYSKDQLYVGLGLGSRYKFSHRSVFTFESLPVYSNGIRLVLGAGIELETGSHVFQMFLTTSSFYTDPYMLRYASNMDKGILNHLRLGFNVNRLFWFD